MPRTATFTNETWLKLQRAAEAMGTTPGEYVERLVADFLRSCDWSLTSAERERAHYHVDDARMALLEATEEEAR